MIQLTEDQREELNAPEPVAIDPRTREMYVLVPKEAYERLKALLSLDEYNAEEGAAYINEIMAEDDANDPLLESYQQFGNRGSCR
jgi:PHD/YefM family antitoxin component YafN of YafNO toxin-antitoxin module